MDRITKSLLDDFIGENLLASATENDQFEHFVSHLTASRVLSDAFDTADIVTGSGGDTGIDGIAIIVNGALVNEPDAIEDFVNRNGYLDVEFIFLQAERSSAFDAQKIGNFGFGVQDFFSETPRLVRNSAIQERAKVMKAIYDRSSRFKRGNPSCKLYYVTTGTWQEDANLVARRESVIEDLNALNIFRAVEFFIYGATEVQRLDRESKNLIARDFEFPARTVVPAIPKVAEAYVGLLLASEFVKLIENENGEILKSIFYDNVRDWQDYNDVNSEIRDAPQSNDLRSRFALMNNGITIIAKELLATGNRFHIEDYQIVNGCQTSHVIHGQKNSIDSSVMVPLRLISTTNDEVIASIIKATNRQTEVKAEQLFAISDFQKKLEAFFNSLPQDSKLYYERRSRQYNNVVGIEKTRIVTPPVLIRSFASIFLGAPHRTTRNYKSLVEQVGKDIFAPDHRLEPYLLAASVYYRLEFLFRNQLLDGKFRAARYQVLYAYRLIALPENYPAMNSRAMERMCEDAMARLRDTETSINDLRAAISVVEELCSELNTDILRTQSFTENMKRKLRG